MKSMDTDIKKLADSGDLKSLKYIFVDSLDVDPTFVRYEEEYNYCKSIPGLLEAHQELTPFTENITSWNEAYWTNLKMDLIKNFSDQRMTHMRKVAKVFLADKIQRILAERSTIVSEKSKNEPVKVGTEPVSSSSVCSNPVKPDVPAKPRLSKAEEQELALKKVKEQLESEQKAEEDRIRAENARRMEQRHQSQSIGINNGKDSKKAQGVAVAAVTVIVVVIVVLAILLLK